jgi:hypothetical protein
MPGVNEVCILVALVLVLGSLVQIALHPPE